LSRRNDLESQRHSLDEISEIMNAMKTLAYMETRKLMDFIDAQQAVVNNMEAAATDFLSFHNHLLPNINAEVSVYLLIGTERGFCGDINQHLLRQFETIFRQKSPLSTPKLIVVGRKLQLLLDNDKRVTALIKGASVAEDVASVLEEVTQQLEKLQIQFGALNVYGLYQEDNSNITVKKLLPPFLSLKNTGVSFSHPPLLNLTPAEFLLALTEHYLLAALHEILYTSLMAENHRRLAHLDGAVQYLEEESQQLLRRSNTLRQEEITEEIEVILLSADSV